jgi:hypothetical protein
VTFLTFFLNLGKGTTYRRVVNALSNTIFDGNKAALPQSLKDSQGTTFHFQPRKKKKENSLLNLNC